MRKLTLAEAHSLLRKWRLPSVFDPAEAVSVTRYCLDLNPKIGDSALDGMTDVVRLALERGWTANAVHMAFDAITLAYAPERQPNMHLMCIFCSRVGDSGHIVDIPGVARVTLPVCLSCGAKFETLCKLVPANRLADDFAAAARDEWLVVHRADQ